jgi:hypothetical protein
VPPADHQIPGPAEVGHHQRAHGAGRPVQLHHPGGGADAPLQAQAAHAGAAAHGALLKGLPGGGDGLEDVLLPDVEALDVVEAAVVALCHQAVDRARVDSRAGVLLQHVPAQAGEGRAHAEGVGEEDGGLDGPQLLDLQNTCALAKAVDDRRRGHHLVQKQVPRVGQHRRDPGVHLPLLYRGVAHPHAGYVGNQIARSAGQGGMQLQRLDSGNTHGVFAPLR